MDYKLKPCPFCGGTGKVSFKDYKFFGKNLYGNRKVSYRVQVICNRCRSRGKPIITDALIDPHPYITDWYIEDKYLSTDKKQTEMFRPYVEKAVDAWNKRVNDARIGDCDGCISDSCDSCVRNQHLCDYYERG